MALDNIERRVVYEGDGSQKDFPFSFVVFKDRFSINRRKPR